MGNFRLSPQRVATSKHHGDTVIMRVPRRRVSVFPFLGELTLPRHLRTNANQGRLLALVLPCANGLCRRNEGMES